MNKNKTNKIIIISLISIISIIILIVAFLIAYMNTDMLKSEKELFFKYAMQVGEEETITKIDQYIKKKKEQAYKNDGSITLEVQIPEESIKNEIESANKVNITFNGNIDNSKQMIQEDISLNYDENVRVPLSFKRDKDIYGIQTEYIGAKYIAIENNKLRELYTKLGISNVSSLPDKIDFDEKDVIQFTDEEKQILVDKYKEVLNSQLSEEQFSKSKNNETTIYTLELTPEQIKSILKQLIETLKTDDIINAKLKKIMDNEITSEDFNELIEEIEEIEIEQNIKIQVYQVNKKLDKIVFEYGTGNQFVIEKVQDKNSLQYNLTCSIIDEESKVKLSINIKYEGLNSLNDVKEIYNIDIEANTEDDISSYKYNIVNNVSFNTDSQIESFDENNVIILNEQDSETILYLMEAIGERFVEVNKSQMEELGLEMNPLMYTNPITISTIMMRQSLERSRNNLSEAIEKENEMLNSLNSDMSDMIEN